MSTILVLGTVLNSRHIVVQRTANVFMEIVFHGQRNKQKTKVKCTVIYVVVSVLKTNKQKKSIRGTKVGGK